MELVALQAELDQNLDQLHEAVRSRSLDLVELAERRSAYIEPLTLRMTSLPPEGSGSAIGVGLSAEIEPTEVDDLFAITLSATGSRGRIQRTRPLSTLFYEPGLSAYLASLDTSSRSREAVP